MREFTSLLVALVFLNFVLAQPPEMARLDELTATAMKHLTANSRFAYREFLYGDIEFGKQFGKEDVTGRFGESVGLEHSTKTWHSPKSVKDYGVWVNGEQFVIVVTADKGGKVVRRQHAAWTEDSDSSEFAAFCSYMGFSHFVLPNCGRRYGLSRNPDSVPLQSRYDETATTVTSVTHQGRACYKVVLTQDGRRMAFKPLVTEYLVDRSHGMVLALRQKGTYHVPKGTTTTKLLDVDQVTEVSYGPPTDNGLPFPTAVKGSFVWPTGRKEPMTDVEFSEFRRYTPTADELDFEKQFGIPLPALPPRPAGSAAAGGSGGRTKWWLLGGLAVVGLAIAAVVVRRRRAAR